MNNYKQPGDVLTLIAPAGGVSSGLGYKLGQIFAVAHADAAATEEFEGQVTGVIELVKDAGTAWTEGMLLYWDDTDNNVTPVAEGNMLIGAAPAAVGSAAVLGDVRLDATARKQIVVSGELTGTGAPANFAHGLGVVPSVVLAILTEFADTLAVDVAYGAHTSTNAVTTITSGAKYKLLCIL